LDAAGIAGVAGVVARGLAVGTFDAGVGEGAPVIEAGAGRCTCRKLPSGFDVVGVADAGLDTCACDRDTIEDTEISTTTAVAMPKYLNDIALNPRL
jgi:hypothetical protein